MKYLFCQTLRLFHILHICISSCLIRIVSGIMIPSLQIRKLKAQWRQRTPAKSTNWLVPNTGLLIPTPVLWPTTLLFQKSKRWMMSFFSRTIKEQTHTQFICWLRKGEISLKTSWSSDPRPLPNTYLHTNTHNWTHNNILALEKGPRHSLKWRLPVPQCFDLRTCGG